MPSPIPVDARTTLLLPLLSAPGAEEAWRVFLGRYWPLIVEWAQRGKVRFHDAEQIASEVLVKLSGGRALTTFDRRRGRFRSWLRSVVRRTALDYRRSQQKACGGCCRIGLKDSLDALFDPASLDGLADELDARLTRDLRLAEAAVERVQARLKSSTWEAYYRTAILGESAVAIADLLGMSVAAVYVAKQRVGTMLREEGRTALG